MREIKFRAWDSKYQKMYYSHGDNPRVSLFHGDWEIDLEGENGDTIGSVSCGKDYPLMQYTGLKDKNGKEIYEGDILKHRVRAYLPVEDKNVEPEIFEHEEINICEHELGAFIFKTKDGNSKSIGWTEEFDNFTEDEYATFEVIGNIYENPELI